MTATSYCNDILDHYSVNYVFRSGEVGAYKLVLGILFLIDGFLIISWIKLQEILAKKGDNNAVKSVIFPVFNIMLWVNAWFNMYVAFCLVFISKPQQHDQDASILSIVAYSIITSLERFVVEGIALLLMEKGMGMYSAQQCFKKAGIWSAITFVVQFCAYYFKNSIGDPLYVTWAVCLITFYAVLIFTPNQHLFRRPAVHKYAMFWLGYEIMELVFVIMSSFARFQAVGRCGNYFGTDIIFALCEPLVVYRTLLRDCRWWQGLALERVESVVSSIDERDVEGAISKPLAGCDLALGTAQHLADTMDQISNESAVRLLNFAYIKLDTKKLLGQGSFSNVYKGTYKDKQCAIKLVYTMDLTVDTIKRIAAEAEILSQIKDSNIVQTFGVSVLPPSVCILLELCKYGSLGDVLRGKMSAHPHPSKKCGKLTINWTDSLFLALGCAKGIAALHQYKGVCHRDIKSFNFLVDSQLNAKIADLELGVSKSAVKGFYRKRRGGAFASGRNPHTNGGFLSCLSCTCPHRDAEADDVGRSSVFSDIRESISNALSMIEPIEEAEHILANWASPEFISDGTYTQASDVYALGLVMWEIASKQLPFDDISDQELLRQMIVDGVRPPIPPKCDPKFALLIESMWVKDPALRPKAQEVVTMIKEMWEQRCYSLASPNRVSYDTLQAQYSKAVEVHSNLSSSPSRSISMGNRMSSALGLKGNSALLKKNMEEKSFPMIEADRLDDLWNHFDSPFHSNSNTNHGNSPKHLETVDGIPHRPSSWALFSSMFPHKLLKNSSLWEKEFGFTALEDVSLFSLMAHEGNSVAVDKVAAESVTSCLAAMSTADSGHAVVQLKGKEGSLNQQDAAAKRPLAQILPVVSAVAAVVRPKDHSEKLYSLNMFPAFTDDPSWLITEDEKSKERRTSSSSSFNPLNNFQVSSSSSMSIDSLTAKSRDFSLDMQTYISDNSIPLSPADCASPVPFAMFVYFSDVLEYTELDIERELDLASLVQNPCNDVTRGSFAIAGARVGGAESSEMNNAIDEEISVF